MDNVCLFRNSGGATRALWEITSRCNLDCRHCYLSKNERSDLSLQDVKRIADSLSSLGIDEVILSGGEPLLRSDIFEIVSYLHLLGHGVDLCTNGTLLDDHAARELSRYLSEISVSLDGYDCMSYERMRGEAKTFNRVIRGIEALGKYGCEVHIITVVTATNYDKLPEIVHLASELGSEFITLLGLVHQQTALRLSAEQQTLARGMIKDLQKRYEGKFAINTKRIFDQPPFHKCRAGLDVFGIDASGNLMPCILLKRLRLWEFGGSGSYSLAHENLARVKAEIEAWLAQKCEFSPSCQKGCLGSYWTQHHRLGCDTLCVYARH
jgi:radical SAM protein with 4Fe4S-binding SPASM domain